MTITELLTRSVTLHASDLHLSAGSPPLIRVSGELKKLHQENYDHITVLNLLKSTMTDEQQQEYQKSLEIDYAFQIKSLCRFRVNAFNQHRGAAGVFRIIPQKIPSLDD